MRSKIAVGIVSAAALVTALAVPVASAQGPTSDKRTFFTFSGPVAVPGATLPAGKYLFRLPTTVASGERHVVQVLSSDGKVSHAQFFGISAVRTNYAEKPEVRFMETGAGAPAAVKTWWYPGDKAGWEFIYPKAQAEALAKGSGQPVLTAKADVPTVVERVTPAGEEMARREEPPAAPTGQAVYGEYAPQALAVPEPQLQARAELPKTASYTFLALYTGAGLVAAAALLKALRVATE